MWTQWRVKLGSLCPGVGTGEEWACEDGAINPDSKVAGGRWNIWGATTDATCSLSKQRSLGIIVHLLDQPPLGRPLIFNVVTAD
jgi:hypothetical protein